MEYFNMLQPAATEMAAKYTLLKAEVETLIREKSTVCSRGLERGALAKMNTF